MTFESYGEYQLLKKLASGGMASIFLARQGGIEGFEKLLVVKRILPHLAENEEFVTMFLDEARIAARLNHPNIVQIFNLGAQDESYFIAMEYIHGEDVRRVFRRAEVEDKAIPVPLICRIIMDAAAGLDYAHAKTDPTGKPLSIVHRDVSPQNIIVTFDGSVKVVDFGIAKAVDQATVTKSGVLKGKYSYMSPEQAAGLKIDHRTDIFALGIVLYELLTGQRLFKRPNDMLTLEAVATCDVPRPSEVDVRLPKDLDEVVLKALAKNPDERFQTAGELRLALEQWLLANKHAASSVQLSAFMREIYAERLAREAQEGRVLVEELDNASRDPLVFRATPQERAQAAKATPAPKPTVSAVATVATQASKPGPPVPEEVSEATTPDRSRSTDHEPPTKTVSEQRGERTESMSFTQAKRRSGRWQWVAAGLGAVLAGATTGGFLAWRATQGATVNISSDPPSAAVTFDGKVLDTVTPCALPRTFAGIHSLTLTRRGYLRVETTLTVPEKGEVTLPAFKLEKDFPVIRNVAFVAFGGAFGSVARYLVAVAAEKLFPDSFPWGTFTVNVLGSALLGAILCAATGEPPRLSAEARLLLGTGVMGGFTTYSTFNAEVLRSLQAGAPGRAVIYLAATVLFCLAGAWAGWSLVRA